MSALRNFASLAIQNVPSEDSDQTAQCAGTFEFLLVRGVQMYIF